MLSIKIKTLLFILFILLVDDLQGIDTKSSKIFPDLTNFKLDGYNREDLKNKILVIDFWASWCAPCKKAFPALCEIQNEYLEKDVVVVGVNVDNNKSSMEKFLIKNNCNFKIFFDIDKKLVSELNVKTMPTTFIVDKNLKIIAEKQGYFKKTKTEIKSILDKLVDEK